MNHIVSAQELLQAQFVLMRIVRVEHTLVKFSYRDNAYADALNRKLFKTSNNGAIAMKGMDNPISIH